MPSELIVDCSGQAALRVQEITDQDVADRLDGLAEANARRDAAVADRKAASQQLKAKAKTDPNLALVCQALGIDLSAGPA